MDCLRVFNTKVAEKEAVEERISCVTTHQNMRSTSFRCKDDMSKTGTRNRITATTPVSLFHNKSCLEPEFSFIRVGCVSRLPFSLPTIKLFMGQPRLVESFDENDPHIVDRNVPAGVSSVSPQNPDVISWTRVVIRERIGALYNNSKSTGCRRIQFPLSIYVASTVQSNG